LIDLKNNFAYFEGLSYNALRLTKYDLTDDYVGTNLD